MKNIFFSLILLIILFQLYIAEEVPLIYPETVGGWQLDNCRSQTSQSPIDIPHTKESGTIVIGQNYAKIESMDYSEVTSGTVKFDGYHKWTTEELNVGTLNIKINNISYKYKLKSIHFHLYSEHRLQNKQYPMEMHMVHQNTDESDTSDTGNKFLVIGVLFDYQNDKENQFLKGMNLATNQPITKANIKELISEKDQFYYYKGSLTTIPCTENVNWVVFRDIKDMSFSQFSKFKKFVEDSNPAYYKNGYGNARGPKQINERKVYLENYQEKGSYDPSNSGQYRIKVGIISKLLYVLPFTLILLNSISVYFGVKSQ